MTYAAFGTPAISQYYQDMTLRCYAAGRDWALTGHCKLPRIADVDGKPVAILRMVTDTAQAFTAGWRAAGKGMVVAQSCPLP
jgi:hypothetical protein